MESPQAWSDPSYDASAVRFRKSPSEPETDVVAETVEPLNEAEQEWVATNVAEAKQMLDGNLSPETLDD